MLPRSPARLIDGLYHQAEAHHRVGQFDAAEELLRYVLATTPNHPDALHLLGVIAYQRTRYDEAADLIGRAIRLRNAVPFYHGNLGLVLRAQQRLEDAVRCFRKAVKIKPDFVEMRYELAVALCTLQQNEEAAQQFRKVLMQRPDYPGAWENLGIALRNLRQWEEAGTAFERAAQREPGRADLLLYAGATRMPLGRMAEAEAFYRRALVLRPDYPELRMSLAANMLLTGRLAEGWPDFEWRWRLAGKQPPSFAGQRWTGEDLAGRTLMIYAEQGFGDTIQFCRYASLFGPEADIVLEVPRPLVRLVETLPGARRVVTKGADMPPYHLHCAMLSLPGAFGTTLDTIPAQTPYLRADPAEVAGWRSRLQGRPRPWVGIAWAGNPQYSQDTDRSVPFDLLTPLLRMPGVTFVSLQKDRASGQPQAPSLLDWTGELTDFADTAALIEALDLVISVDSAVAHLAGALARPVWLLNRFNTEWRWLRDREDSPWYPTLRQFRQKRLGDWEGVLQAVAAALHPLRQPAASA